MVRTQGSNCGFCACGRRCPVFSPLVCRALCQICVVPSWHHFCPSPLSPLTYEKAKKILSVSPSVCLTWKQRLLHAACLSVLVGGEFYGREVGVTVSSAVWEALESDGSGDPGPQSALGPGEMPGSAPQPPRHSCCVGDTGGSDSGRGIPGLTWQEVDLNTRMRVDYTSKERELYSLSSSK